MQLVQYSDSEPDTDQIGRQAVVAKRALLHPEGSSQNGLSAAGAPAPPPLPKAFRTLYSTSVRNSTVDDPALHAGRLRQTPHVQGNWATHLYLEWYPSPAELTWLEDLLRDAVSEPGSQIQPLLYSALGARLPLHISLSAPLVLQTYQRQDFLDATKRKLHLNHIGRFAVTVIDLAWVANEDATRHFLVIRFAKPTNNELNELLRICNECARDLGLPVLYGQPQLHKGIIEAAFFDADHTSEFHISIAWQLEIPTLSQMNLLTTLNMSDRLKKEISFSTLYIKIGNSITQLSLE